MLGDMVCGSLAYGPVLKPMVKEHGEASLNR